MLKVRSSLVLFNSLNFCVRVRARVTLYSSMYLKYIRVKRKMLHTFFLQEKRYCILMYFTEF